MKYAVVKAGGKQYKIAEGDILEVDRLSDLDKKELILEDVLLYTADSGVKVGNPFVSGVTVKASILGDTLGEKIRVSKFKSKVRYRKVTGHRQKLTKIKIEKIEAKGEKESTSAKKDSEKKSPKEVVK